MSTFIYPEYGTKLSEKYKKYEKIYDACIDAGIEPPKEVTDYFEKFEEKDFSIYDDIAYEQIDESLFQRGQDDGQSFIIIDVKNIPKNVDKIRFVIDY